MGAIKLGCQTYAWQMSGEAYLGRLDHIIAVAGKSGFGGIEAETQFLGALRDPAVMREHLSRNAVELASLCIVEDWRASEESEGERANGDWVIDYLARHFPSAVLNICPMPGRDRTDLSERQANQLSCMNALARRAADNGLTAAYHPNSPMGSVCRTREDYERMLHGLDADVLGWVPDVGHIAKGGMDPLDLMKTFRSLIRHVHFKDMDENGGWKRMGEGALPFEAITRFLAQTGYGGWLVVEDESTEAETDPDAVTIFDGHYLDRQIKPLLTANA